MKQQLDYIIVGSGLAGISLACALIDRNKDIAIFNYTGLHSSTKVAAGLYNPITGRNMKKTWKVDQLFPSLITYYKKLEGITNANFLHENRIYRPFVSLQEQNEWMGRSSIPEYADYIHRIHISSFHKSINNSFGGMELSQSGYLDTQLFHSSMQNYFCSKELLKEEKFDIQKLKFECGKVTYENLEASKIIFCEGTYLSVNPYFDWLPFSPVKGEILTIQSPLEVNAIINRGVFCVPLGKGQFRVGSNYDNNDLTWTPTEGGKSQIEEKLKVLINTPFETIHQKAGVRPATKDRRPYMGLHPSNETIGVFNGLGTKGVSLAPFFGAHFADFLDGKTELDSEVNISRYFSLS